MKPKIKLKKKWIKLFLNILTLLLLTILVYSIYNIITYKKDENNTIKNINKIDNSLIINEIKDTEETEIIKQQEEIPETNPYWDYIKMNLIDVDFKDLKTINNDIKGWIKVNGTNINYPFVQSNDNKYYLTHSLDKSYNKAGWVFLDYRNDISNFENKNTIIYAHGRQDKTMFGTLKNTLNEEWLNNTDNHVIKLSTEYENTIWQVFSIYKIPSTSDYIQTEFTDENTFQTFIDLISSRSIYNFNNSVSANDRILTLSTCYDKKNRIAIHAKLIKREQK